MATSAATRSEDRRRVLCMGGGEPGRPAEGLHDYVLGLAARPEPRICFMPTASGDRSEWIARFYFEFGRRACEPSHISLVRHAMPLGRVESHLLDQDVVYVGDGNVTSLLAVWRAHGVDRVLREAWEAGIVLCGSDAGSTCWFDHATSGLGVEPQMTPGLGLLRGTLLPGARDGAHPPPTGADRVPGTARPAFLLDRAAAILFRGTDASEVVAARAGARAYRLADGDERPAELPLAPRVVEPDPRPRAHSAIEEFRQVRLAQRAARELNRRRGGRG